MIKVPRKILSDPEAALSREWLVTNGIGGYASSTVIGANTRRYHGLLVASFPPPLERQIVLAKVDEEITYESETYPLGTNEFHDGTIHPEGYLNLHGFRLEDGIPTFEYQAGPVRLVKQIWMEDGKDTVYILYRLIESPENVRLTIKPFCVFRGYHQDGVYRKNEYLGVVRDNQVIVESAHASYSLRMRLSGGDFVSGSDWHRDFLHRAERDRGFSALEDLFTPGIFIANIPSGGSAGLIATCEREIPDEDVNEALERELGRRKKIMGSERSAFRRQLLLAADQFVVKPPPARGETDEKSCHAILAGYHWFTDWGRDTMIALPGLLLSTRRFDEAREILVRYIEWADGGMVPNRFTDEGSVEYNTADATLWYFHALHAYVSASGDEEIVREVFASLEEIVDWHIKGTRFGIHCDPKDGLLHAGRGGSQVTWMDACVNGCPATPRIGKPVEINALWHNALNLMSSWARYVGKPADTYESGAERCGASFRRRFWYADSEYLYDVVDGPNGDDSSLRPNQITAVSLPNSPLYSRQQKSVVDAVERALLTPFGLRTLSPDDPAYSGRYSGGPEERDCIYHQGTAWPWLLGQFADAHYRVYRDRDQISALIEPFRKQLSESGVGNINEIYDGDPPHRPGGAIAQAWSVAEILRVLTNLPSLA